jgi:hypothetical protein
MSITYKSKYLLFKALGKSSSGYEGDIEMVIKETGREGVHCGT